MTVADEAAEAHARASGLLQRIILGCVVVGEEATAADPSLLGRIADADLAFVVDPIDGTANYAAGLPLFGTMAAAIVRGEVVAAVIHDPVGQDTAFALRGEGAWIEASDGTRQDLRAADPVPVSWMTGAASWRNLAEGVRERVCGNLVRVAASWDFRCAAHQYRMLAAGSCHFLLFNRLMPWDHAPGWLLHREAGGYASRLDGTAYTPHADRRRAALHAGSGLVGPAAERPVRGLSRHAGHGPGAHHVRKAGRLEREWSDAAAPPS